MAGITRIQVMGGPDIAPDMVVKLRGGNERAAGAAATWNGAEDIFITIGRDTYVASRRTGGSRVQVGDSVNLGGKPGKVIAKDDDTAYSEAITQAPGEVGPTAGRYMSALGIFSTAAARLASALSMFRSIRTVAADLRRPEADLEVLADFGEVVG